MHTVPTKINGFSIGDTFLYYGATFQVTGELETWTGHNGREDTSTTYGRSCKCIENPDKDSTIAGLLNGYEWMQGTEEVTYEKIVYYINVKN